MSDFWNVDLRVGLTTERWEVLAYVRNLLDNDVVAFTGGGPSLGCCFMLGSSIDLDAETDPDTGEVTYQDPGTAVIVDLPLFTTAFLPDPRVIGLRATFRFGGS